MTLEEHLRRRVRRAFYCRLSRSSVRQTLEHDRDNRLVPATVGSGLPMSEEEVRATYDRVLQAFEERRIVEPRGHWSEE